ncbi:MULTISPECIES: fatty acid desaturase family protein [unclassified Serratia (in: enterobacteria)]|uniref:fatty acid desaturase family protein n=1 Tax=unclassified Serratia (in: enterobacteria) TaxID=2647522 RepID=UPI00307687E9
MKIWKYSRWDVLMLMMSLSQFVVTIWLAVQWGEASWGAWILNVMLLVLMTTYNIIVISHFFTHTPWFSSAALNAAVSVLNSINIGQSVQAYHLTHVRNHHRYNNDQGKQTQPPQDTSSTYLEGENGEHISLMSYTVRGALGTWWRSWVACGKALCFWKCHSEAVEPALYYSRSEAASARERAQLRWDRVAQGAILILLLFLAWDWVLLCYLPSLYLAFVLVNVQNYYEHYGANPDDRFANSVSYYGRFYNFMAFNDGYHQEHHLAPSVHWRKLPQTHLQYARQLTEHPRIVSPVPAIVGFLHRQRPLLHTRIDTGYVLQSD